ncbi:MAG: hypothetical protein LBS45_08450 [Synergistaceae bacterium]|jgi:predicted  nucleic acid-binding Zn-ribbon protein|nr:hypothetical protein [Synergistaceae bacterium]
MIAKITEIEGIIDKLESVIIKLRDERDRAVDELSAAKKALDDRELELLQMDEEMQREAARFEDERNMIKQERDDAGGRLEKLASRIRELVSFLPEGGAVPAQSVIPTNTTINFSED